MISASFNCGNDALRTLSIRREISVKPESAQAGNARTSSRVMAEGRKPHRRALGIMWLSKLMYERMCTATWIHDQEGYQLLFNRDEKLTRKQAAPPRLAVRNGVRFLAPADGDFGGTWIAVNEFGVSACLLNGANMTGVTSRGLLLLDSITERSAAAVCERVCGLDLSPFAPFTVVAFEPGRPAALVQWNGAKTTFVPYGDSYMPLTSSSFDPWRVRRERRDEFCRLLTSRGHLDADLLFEYHRSHGPARGPYSPCMHRADAETMSFSWIRVTPSGASFFYNPAAPCKITEPLADARGSELRI